MPPQTPPSAAAASWTTTLLLLTVLAAPLLLLEPVSAVIPTACVHNVTENHVCCPVEEKSGEVCGGSQRGFCAPVDVFRDKVPTPYMQDERVHWPVHFFKHMCKCHGNFYGVACEECWYGWEGENCDRREPVRVRKNWLSLSRKEKKDFQRVLEISYHKRSDFMVIIEQDNWRSDPLKQPIFVPSNIHYFMVVLHRFASRTTLFHSEQMCQKYGILDFNHDGSSFVTWHRFFMMFWERLLRKIALEELHLEDFSLPYWDWTDETECAVCTNDMAGSEGTVDRYGLRFSQKSPFYNWTEYCSEPTDGAICYGCHYSGTFGKLTRRWNNRIMPTTEDIDFVMGHHKFFDHTEKSGAGEECKSFHMAVEGFCGPPGVNNSRLYMHNFVHNSLDGSMCCSATATGDPLFIVHHVEVDRMVEAWLLDNKPNLYEFPNSGVRPGHCRECFMAGFLPPVRHADIFSHSSKEFSYTYDNFRFGKQGREFGTGTPAPAVTPTQRALNDGTYQNPLGNSVNTNKLSGISNSDDTSSSTGDGTWSSITGDDKASLTSDGTSSSSSTGDDASSITADDFSLASGDGTSSSTGTGDDTAASLTSDDTAWLNVDGLTDVLDLGSANVVVMKKK